MRRGAPMGALSPRRFTRPRPRDLRLRREEGKVARSQSLEGWALVEGEKTISATNPPHTLRIGEVRSALQTHQRPLSPHPHGQLEELLLGNGVVVVAVPSPELVRQTCSEAVLFFISTRH